ncbi:hypothetical protein P8452_59316 [Trifolium repens]|nr:hypothetical protein P8452_59316 [Trifolium repens]
MATTGACFTVNQYYFPPSSDQKFNSMSADVTMKATISVSSGENSCLDTIVSDQQIPRRASKRLAGIKAGPLPELKTI